MKIKFAAAESEDSERVLGEESLILSIFARAVLDILRSEKEFKSYRDDARRWLFNDSDQSMFSAQWYSALLGDGHLDRFRKMVLAADTEDRRKDVYINFRRYKFVKKSRWSKDAPFEI